MTKNQSSQRKNSWPSPCRRRQVPRRRRPSLQRTRLLSHFLDLLCVMILKHRLSQTRRPKVVLFIVGALTVLLYWWNHHHVDWGKQGLVEVLDLLLLFGLYAAWVIYIKYLGWWFGCRRRASCRLWLRCLWTGLLSWELTFCTLRTFVRKKITCTMSVGNREVPGFQVDAWWRSPSRECDRIVFSVRADHQSSKIIFFEFRLEVR